MMMGGCRGLERCLSPEKVSTNVQWMSAKRYADIENTQSDVRIARPGASGVGAFSIRLVQDLKLSRRYECLI
jgi:hypothetical protein